MVLNDCYNLRRNPLGITRVTFRHRLKNDNGHRTTRLNFQRRSGVPRKHHSKKHSGLHLKEVVFSLRYCTLRTCNFGKYSESSGRLRMLGLAYNSKYNSLSGIPWFFGSQTIFFAPQTFAY